MKWLTFLLAALAVRSLHAQQTAPPAGHEAEKAPEIPAQIELLETRVRFESNGDSRKDVHAHVRIHNELGARQFARLNFDYNRSFQQIEIPLVRITHASGGTADILPSAISDQPNPAVVNAPAYQDVRVKSVRILGLAPGDNLEYQVITTTTKHPLAPDFWLDHTFDRSGVVLKEIFELNLPGHISSVATMSPNWNGTLPVVYLKVPYTSYNTTGDDTSIRSIYLWEIASGLNLSPAQEGASAPDVLVSSISSWSRLVARLAPLLLQPSQDDRNAAAAKLRALVPSTAQNKLRTAYDFVSQKLSTLDLPVGASGFRLRHVKEIFDSGYATSEEKCFVLAQLAHAANIEAEVVLTADPGTPKQYPRPSAFNHVFLISSENKRYIAVDPSLEVAPFGLVPPQFRAKPALSLAPFDAGDYVTAKWLSLPVELPFPSSQHVNLDAALSPDGTLTSTIHYTMRGDNELLLRMAFHNTPRAKWADVAQLLALSDGFRGKVTKVTASDPYATKEPFTLEYEITQPKFVDWSRKPVRIPALLPVFGLPDPPLRSTGSAPSAIELGTPLDVQAKIVLHLPQGTTPRTPPSTTVQRDYANFSSQYAALGETVSAFRHLKFLLREIPADRTADYLAFIRAVRNDEAQEFTLHRPESSSPTPTPSSTESKPATAKPSPSTQAP